MTRLVWTCAAITMATSALTGYTTFAALTGGVAALGLLTGCSVDLGLCIGLIGDRQLHAHGLESPYGRVLRWVCGAMSVLLNCGAALIDQHWFLALLHAFIPTVLVAVTEYGQSCSLGYTRLIREGELAEQAATAAAAEAQRTRVEAAQREAARAAELARQTQLRELASAVPERPTALSLVPRRPQPPVAPVVSPRRPSPARDTALAWLAARVLENRDLGTIHYRELAEATGLKVDTCKKSLPRWLAQLGERSEVAI